MDISATTNTEEQSWKVKNRVMPLPEVPLEYREKLARVTDLQLL